MKTLDKNATLPCQRFFSQNVEAMAEFSYDRITDNRLVYFEGLTATVVGGYNHGYPLNHTYRNAR